MAALHELTALEQAAALRRGELSHTELVDHYLDRIEAYSDQFGAFVTVTAEAARAAATRADARKRGHSPSPLAGVPTAVKDLTLTAGVRTTYGSAAFADFVPDVDADVVVRMREGGLISLGKTTPSEFGLSLYCETEVAPPVRNPWSPEHTAGGSSGGAAAAVAAALVPLAHGNDGGGSIRIPSCLCGLVGFKPSRGLVSGGPLGFGAFGLTADGPIARTVADAAALLDVMAGAGPGQPSWRPAGEPHWPPPRSADGLLDAARSPGAYLPSRRPLRVGCYLAPLLAEVTPDPQVVAVWERARAALAGFGFEVIDVAAPFQPDSRPMFETVWWALSLSPVPADREHLLQPLTRWVRERGRAVSAESLVLALAGLQATVRAHARGLDADVLLSPVLARPQAPVGYFTASGDPATDFAEQERFSPYCAAYNLTGAPAVSVPVGQAGDGTPIGVMLSAAVGADALLIAVSALLEEALPWRGPHARVWAPPRGVGVPGAGLT